METNRERTRERLISFPNLSEPGTDYEMSEYSSSLIGSGL